MMVCHAAMIIRWRLQTSAGRMLGRVLHRQDLKVQKRTKRRTCAHNLWQDTIKRLTCFYEMISAGGGE
eukprot:689329-Amphidinium_carterae.1